tara:strand:- start:4519 stop:6732 length:2214 start_codon:yes stop_codon:yes gene_type:complete
MRRRSPVRSVLAERKMFAGGGMLPISTPMKKEPSGILASSEPLIDAVSQEILAPMTGGAMPMAQGGIARFQRGGGAISLGQAPDMDMSFLPDFKSSVERFNKMIDSGAFRTQPTVAETVIETAPPPTDMSFLPNFKSSVERFNKMIDSGAFRTQPQEREESGAQPPSTEQPLSTDLTGTPSFRSRRDIDAENLGGDVTQVGMNTDDELVKQENVDLGDDSSIKKDNTFNLSDWLKQNPDKSTKTAPKDVVNNSIDSIFSDAFKSLKGEKFDVNKFKNEIEDLLPETKEDPQMEGLLIAMLGASIAGGTSENPLKNISSGLTQSMPALLNFKNKQKEKQDARNMTIAKLAIETKLSREGERRKDIKDLEAQKRGISIDLFKASEADRIAKEREDRVTGNYMVVRNTTLPGKSFDPKAPENSVVNIPFNTKMNISKGEAQRLQGMGIPIFEVGKPSFEIGDLLASTTPASGLKGLSPTEINKLLKTEKTELFKFGSEAGIKADYYLPTALGLSRNITDPFMSDQQWSSIFLKYRDYRKKFERLGDKLNVLYDAARSGKLTGVKGLRGRIGDSLRGLGNLKYAKKFADALLDNEKLSAGGVFDVNARLVLAEIAPFILGESGRTISDTDRVRVAKSLGYEASLEDGVMYITGFDSNLLTSPEQIKAALKEITGVINRYIELGDSEMQQAMIKYGRITDEQTSQILQSVSKERLSEMKDEVKANQAKRKIDVVDLDLTQGL